MKWYFPLSDNILRCFPLTGRPDYSVSGRWHSWIQLYENIYLPLFGLHAVSPGGQMEPVPGAPSIRRHGGVCAPQTSSVGQRHQRGTEPGAKSRDMLNETERAASGPNEMQPALHVPQAPVKEHLMYEARSRLWVVPFVGCTRSAWICACDTDKK